MAEAVAVAGLAIVLAWAVRRPRDWPEAAAALPTAALVIGIGAVTPHAALAEARRLAPVVGFLACVLVLVTVIPAVALSVLALWLGLHATGALTRVVGAFDPDRRGRWRI